MHKSFSIHVTEDNREVFGCWLLKQNDVVSIRSVGCFHSSEGFSQAIPDFEDSPA